MEPDEEIKSVTRAVHKVTKHKKAVASVEQPDKDRKENGGEERTGILDPPQDKSKEPPLVAGYEVEDLLKTPVKPPEPVKTETRPPTRATSVTFLMGGGVILFVLGFILALAASGILGLILAIIGAILVIVGVFAPFRE